MVVFVSGMVVKTFAIIVIQVLAVGVYSRTLVSLASPYKHDCARIAMRRQGLACKTNRTTPSGHP